MEYWASVRLFRFMQVQERLWLVRSPARPAPTTNTCTEYFAHLTYGIYIHWHLFSDVLMIMKGMTMVTILLRIVLEMCVMVTIMVKWAADHVDHHSIMGWSSQDPTIPRSSRSWWSELLIIFEGRSAFKSGLVGRPTWLFLLSIAHSLSANSLSVDSLTTN